VISVRRYPPVAGVIRRHRTRTGSCWRKLNPGQQALLVLAHLRKGETLAELAARFGVGTATAWRYVTETARLLAARAPKLAPALRAAKKAGGYIGAGQHVLTPHRGRGKPSLAESCQPRPRPAASAR
jgi:hypothetical protein